MDNNYGQFGQLQGTTIICSLKEWEIISMKGIKLILFGLMFIMIGGFILIDPQSSFGGFGEMILFAIGIGFGIVGIRSDN